MRRVETTTRYTISTSQLLILDMLHKYRFLTSDLLAALLHKDRSTIYERLAVLVEQEYVTKKYNSTYRIDRRPAAYYLAPAGIRYLKKQGYSRTQLHYKNKDLTESQIDEYYLHTALALALRKNNPHIDHTFTKYQLNPEEYVKPTPWLLFESDSDTTPDFFMEYIPSGTLSWIIRKRINSHIEFCEESEYTYPYLLLVAGNDSTEKRIINLSSGLLWDSELYTTTEERLLSGKKNIWLQAYDVDWDEELEYHTLPTKYED